MDGVALAAVLSSACLGAGGLGVTVWSSRRSERREDEVRRQGRLADTYVSVLALAEREGHWVRSEASLLEWTTDEPYTDRPIVIERPSLDNRLTVEARLLGFGTDAVVAAYQAWRRSVEDLDAEHTNIEWNVGQDGRDPGQPLGRSYITTFLGLVEPHEKARQELINAIAKDLKSR